MKRSKQSKKALGLETLFENAPIKKVLGWDSKRIYSHQPFLALKGDGRVRYVKVGNSTVTNQPKNRNPVNDERVRWTYEALLSLVQMQFSSRMPTKTT